jgi:DMSO/TMAO reductase YedYZ molybdopterin-dependent catalytic subunit
MTNPAKRMMMTLSDTTMGEAMTTYRQALRDIPNQDGFPFDVVWPTIS